MGYNQEKIGANIRAWRESIGMSIPQLAERLGVSIAHMGLMERGQRGTKIEYLIKISQLSKISIDELCENSLPTVDTKDTENSELANVMYQLSLLNKYNLRATVSFITQVNQLQATKDGQQALELIFENSDNIYKYTIDLLNFYQETLNWSNSENTTDEG